MTREQVDARREQLVLDEVYRRLRENDPTLTTLDLSRSDIGDAEAEALAAALKNNTTLEELILEDNQIGDDGTVALAAVLQTNSTLQVLYLGSNQIGDEGACALATALVTNTTLRVLHLGDNRIGANGAKALAEALETNSSLQDLYLRNNRVGDSGAKALATALKTNTALRELDVWSNQIGDDGAKALLQTLQQHNGTLTYLGLNSDDGISDDLKSDISEVVKHNEYTTRNPPPRPTVTQSHHILGFQPNTTLDRSGYRTSWLSPGNAELDVGDLLVSSATAESRGPSGSPSKDLPLFFLSHTSGIDSGKEEIIRPTYWLLTKYLELPVFFDEAIPVGQDVLSYRRKAASECTHAMVLLSPRYRQRRWCVKELNTFMKRRQNAERPLSLVPVTWGWETDTGRRDSLEGYANQVRDLAWIQPETPDAALFLVNTLWPLLIQLFNLSVEASIEDLLVQYAEENRGISSIPLSLESFVQARFRFARKWTKLPSPVTPRVACGVALWGDFKIILVGGQRRKKAAAVTESLQALRSVEVFDATTQEWSELPSLQTSRYHCSAVVVGEFLHVFGGYDGSVTLNDMEVLSLRGIDSQFEVVNGYLPEGRRQMGALGFEESVMLFGGRLNPFGTNAWLAQVRDRTVAALDSLTLGRACPVVLPHKTDVFVIGGQGEDGTWLSSVEVYVILTNSRSSKKIPNMPISGERVLSAYVKEEDGNSALVIHFERGVYTFDFRESTWSSEVEQKWWGGGRKIDQCVYSDAQACLVCVNAAANLELFKLPEEIHQDDLYSTALIGGSPKPVGELSVDYVSDPGKAWPMRKSNCRPLVYLAHRGPDAKKDIAGPICDHLEKIHGVDVFFDEKKMPIGDDKMHTLVSKAHECTHALVILSPTFRESEYCVKELNTFMARWEKGNGFRLFLSLWNVDDVDGYAPVVNDVIGHRVAGANKVHYIVSLYTKLEEFLPATTNW